jgi:multicomponent Na+:H+ antiporter subunit B
VTARDPQASPLVLQVAARYVPPLLILFSLFLLFRGHDLPGGAFTGGLVATTAFSLYAIADDVATARRAIRFHPRVVIAGGLAVMGAAAVLPLLAGEPLLTAVWLDLTLPGGRGLTVGSPLLFEIGVYLVVLGATVAIVLLMAEE